MDFLLSRPPIFAKEVPLSNLHKHFATGGDFDLNRPFVDLFSVHFGVWEDIFYESRCRLSLLVPTVSVAAKSDIKLHRCLAKAHNRSAKAANMLRARSGEDGGSRKATDVLHGDSAGEEAMHFPKELPVTAPL